MTWKINILAGVFAAMLPGLAVAACEDIRFDDAPFTVCRFEAGDDIRLFLRDERAEVFGQFTTLDKTLRADGEHLVMAMNGGMYHPDRSPVGHYIENGAEARRVITGASAGNFGLLPNGVLCIAPTRVDVMETMAYVAAAPDCDHATQSGPMLVIDGALHPRFLPDSPSKYLRNGVGTSADGQEIIFAISNKPVTFHHFARLFRDHLTLPRALYFDGKVSRLFAPEIGRSDAGFWIGPIVGVVAPVTPTAPALDENTAD